MEDNQRGHVNDAGKARPVGPAGAGQDRVDFLCRGCHQPGCVCELPEKSRRRLDAEHDKQAGGLCLVRCHEPKEVRAKCGRCGIALRNGRPAVLTPENFTALAERSDVPLLVDFWAPWCGPCRQMAPAFSAAADLLEPALRLAKLNTEAEQGLAQRYGIQSIPTLMILHKGRVIARQSGAMPTTAIVAWAQKALSHRGVSNH